MATHEGAGGQWHMRSGQAVAYEGQWHRIGAGSGIGEAGGQWRLMKGRAGSGDSS